MSITFEHISHNYGTHSSVCDIDFAVGESEVVSLLGPSGCGKTTLLRLAAGFDKPSRGRISMHDRLLSTPQNLIPPEQRDMGLVFQSYALFPHMTVMQNVMFGLPKKDDFEATQNVRALLEEFHLSALSAKYPHELSGGQQQRVAIARALAPQPKLILLDEPYSGLDSRLRERVRDQVLHALRQAGTAALMVTHDAEEAMFMSDRIIVLNEGRIVQIGRPIDLYCRPQNAFVAAFFGEVNHVPAIGHHGMAKSIFGHFPCEGIETDQKAVIVIRYEALQVCFHDIGENPADGQGENLGEGRGGSKAIEAIVVESHLLGRASLLHLSVPDPEKRQGDLHMHARIPGLNSFQRGEPIKIKVDPAQVFVFT